MGIKLVIVDDAPFIREAVRSLIRGTEIELLGEASDGEEAVNLLKSKKPDVILMDMVLPKKNGIEATREILKDNPKIKIVACSTEGQESMLLKALEAGCCSFLAKPFKAEELLKSIRTAGGKTK
jgi:two-component system, chemotaxis family, chemotaxis protein CheY